MELLENQFDLGGVLLMGAGTEYVYSGLRKALAPVRSGDQPAPGRSGRLFGSDFRDGATWELTVTVRTLRGEAAAVQLIDELRGAWADAGRDTYLRYRPRGRRTRIVLGRTRDLDDDRVTVRAGVATIPLVFASEDWREYDDEVTEEGVEVPRDQAGLEFPLEFPITFGTVDASGRNTAVLTNAGTAPTSPVVYVKGPVLNPRLENLTTGKWLGIDAALGDTEVLIVDMANRTVLQGSASRRDRLARGSTWWDLPKGASTAKLSGTQEQDTPRGGATFRFRSAWA